MAASTNRRITSTPHVQRRAVVRRSLILAGLAVLAVPGLALRRRTAAPAAAWSDRTRSSWPASRMAFAAGLCALGQGTAVASAVDAMARQPGAAARIQTAMIIGLALIESLAIYVLVVAMILLFVQPIK